MTHRRITAALLLLQFYWAGIGSVFAGEHVHVEATGTTVHRHAAAHAYGGPHHHLARDVAHNHGPHTHASVAHASVAHEHVHQHARDRAQPSHDDAAAYDQHPLTHQAESLLECLFSGITKLRSQLPHVDAPDAVLALIPGAAQSSQDDDSGEVSASPASIGRLASPGLQRSHLPRPPPVS